MMDTEIVLTLIILLALKAAGLAYLAKMKKTTEPVVPETADFRNHLSPCSCGFDYDEWEAETSLKRKKWFSSREFEEKHLRSDHYSDLGRHNRRRKYVPDLTRWYTRFYKLKTKYGLKLNEKWFMCRMCAAITLRSRVPPYIQATHGIDVGNQLIRRSRLCQLMPGAQGLSPIRAVKPLRSRGDDGVVPMVRWQGEIYQHSPLMVAFTEGEEE